MEAVSYLLIIVVCLVLSGFFSSSETALLRIQEHELKQDVEAATGPAAVATRDLLRSTSQLLVTILFGNNLVNILGASVASSLGVRYLGEQWGVATAAMLMTIIVLIFCEVLPKAIAAQHPRRIAYFVALPLYLLNHAMRPLHIVYDRLIDPFVKRVAGSDADSAPMSTAEEVIQLARGMSKENAAGTPLAIIGATAGAAEMTVSDIMVPRAEIVAFPSNHPPSELLDEILEERYTRVPIYTDTIDNIVGVVHLKDLVELVRSGKNDLNAVIKTVLRVPERKPILRLLTDMQRAFAHLAIVKDEFGDTRGMVTQEDILEELVGEIRDEFDREELLTIRRIDEDTFQTVGRVKVLDFNRETGWEVTAERGDTLAGLLFNTLGHAPRRGEVVRVGDYELTVADVSGSRITQVRAYRCPQPATDTIAEQE